MGSRGAPLLPDHPPSITHDPEDIMPIDYVLKRVGFFLIIVWLAATLNFFIPRLSSQNPVRERLLEQALLGGYVHAGMADMVAEYEQKFGLDQPLYIQYVRYIGDLVQGDFN